MGGLFSDCFVNFQQHRNAKRHKSTNAILRQSGNRLREMQVKYQKDIQEVELAIQVGRNMPSESKFEQESKRDRLMSLLKKRRTLRHYLNVCVKRNEQVLAKTLACEALEVNAMQVAALKQTAKAFESFSKKNNVENLERVSDDLAEHMNALSEIDDLMADSLPLNFDDDDQEELLQELAELSDPFQEKNKENSVINVSAEMLSMPQPPSQLPTSAPAVALTLKEPKKDELVGIEISEIQPNMIQPL